MLRIAAAALLIFPSPALAAPPKPGKTVDADEQVCKKMPRPGSFVPGRKVCKTAGEWEELAQNAQNTTEDMRRPNGWSPCPDGGTPAGTKYDPSMPRIGC